MYSRSDFIVKKEEKVTSSPDPW